MQSFLFLDGRESNISACLNSGEMLVSEEKEKEKGGVYRYSYLGCLRWDGLEVKDGICQS